MLFTIELSAQVSVQAIPDIDGKLPANISANSLQHVQFAKNPTDFPEFSGFPILGSYTSFSPKNGAIAVNMDSDADLEIVYGTGDKLYAVNLDGTPVPGWPKTYIANWEAVYTPSVGDINGDGQDEIVCSNGGALGGKIYAYKKDGTDCPGFPVTTGKYPMIPILADVDKDGKMEIIIGNRSSQVHVYKGDGTIMTGWPQVMNKYIAANCAAGDINNDGKVEIIAESSNRLYAWDKDGKILAGFPYILADTVNGSNSYSSPVLADLDKNGKKQIIFCSHASSDNNGGTIHVVNPDGSSYPGWPKTGFSPNWIYSTAAVADMDGDGYLDIIVPEYAASTDPLAAVFGFKRNGSALAGFPKGPYFGSANQPTIVDIDNDGKYEIILDQNIQYGDYGQYICLKADNSQVANWPVNVRLNTGFQQPVLTDLNKDGKLDIVGAGFAFSTDHFVYLTALNTGLKYDASKIVVPCYQFNLRHDGNFETSPTVPVELTSFKANAAGNIVTLKWETATESNNAYFELFRNNSVIAKVDGKGTTAQKSSYSFVDNNVAVGSYSYKLVQHDFDGTVKEIGSLNVNVSGVASFQLNQNYPNPFNPSTVISYNLTAESLVKLNVFNALGQKVAALVNGIENSGMHQISFNAKNLTSGVYTYSIEIAPRDGSASIFQSKKMILAK
jgi:hypothetical protein